MASCSIRPAAYPGADDPNVRLLVETGAAELIAAELWLCWFERGDPALVDP